MSALPTVTCSKCGFQRTVTKSPEATLAWFRKWHYKMCDGTPIYQAGAQLGTTRLEGQ